MSRTPDVVIVDHDLEALKKLVEPLREDFEFYLTISGNDALTMLARHGIGMIIAGQTLFSGSGIEVLINARSRSPRTTRVLLATGVERKAVEHVLERAEVFQVLKRPCTSEQLKEVLQAASWSARVRPEAGSIEHVVMESVDPRSVPASASGAPVTVLTTDSGLYEAIRAAVHEHHDVHLATRESDAIELATAGQCAVLVTDQALTHAALARATHALKAREPALVTVAAGNREQGNALMGLLGTGQIHRFLLKPVAPGLARLAIDSAARQHSSLKAHPRPDPTHKGAARPATVHRAPARAPPADETPADSESAFQLRPMLSGPRTDGPEIEEAAYAPQRERSARQWMFAGAGVLAVAAIGAALWWWITSRPPAIDPRQVGIERALAAAEQAYRAGRFVEPEDASALHYYEEALKIDAAQPAAAAGLDRIADQYIQQAEALMVEGELEAAAAALATVRRVRPDHKRLLFLDTQLKKDQQELLVLQARQSATQGDLREAQELLTQAEQVTAAGSTEVAAAQAAVSEQERGAQVGRMLDSARQRLTQGRLVTPVGDSAKFFASSAQRLEPDNPAAQQVMQNLRERVVGEADAAIGARQFDAARNWIREARDINVDAAEITRLQGALAASLGQKSKNDMLALAVRRTQENRLLDPAQDSAAFYVTKLGETDPGYPGLDAAVAGLGAKLVANAQTATTQRQFDSATRYLGGARQIGYAGADLAAAESALRTATLPAPVAPRIPQPVAPKRTKYVAPKYPTDALEDGLTGWVDVSFTVTPEGDVTDARVEEAQPRNRFDRAALSSVRQWKFEPRAADATDPTLRVKTRVRFELSD